MTENMWTNPNYKWVWMGYRSMYYSNTVKLPSDNWD